jgi:D-glutamate N-acetyltransferase
MTSSPADRRFLVLADGQFGPETSKTANSCLRYFPERIVGVFDRAQAGKTAQQVLGYGGAIPVVGDFAAGLALGGGATAVLIGIAPPGGRLPDEWRGWLATAIERKLEIWSGLHTFLSDDPELGPLARRLGVRLLDARKPPATLPIADGRAKDVDAYVVHAVGSDCNVGKMTAMLEVRAALIRAGHRARFAATGQTGIFIEGWGTAVDAVVADFIAGAAEELVLRAAQDADIVLVEGQGSLLHPGYSGVTLGLLHGSMPRALILCHQSSRDFIGDYHGRTPWVKIPPLPELVEIYERAAQPVFPTRVIGVCLNTYDLDETAARQAVRQAEQETGLPATDPVRFDAAPLADAVVRAAREWRGRR